MRGNPDELPEAVRALEQRVQALEAALERAEGGERLFRTMVENAPGYVVLLTLDARYRYVNRLAPGLRHEDVIGASMFDYVAPESHADARRCLDRVRETGQADSYEALGFAGPGKPARYLTRVAPVLEGGTPAGFIAVTTDVTRMKDAEAAARESQDRLQFVLDVTGTGIWVWDVAGGPGLADLNTRRMFGWGADEVVGPSEVFTALHPDDRERVQRSLGEALASGRYGPIEHRVIRPDGSVRWLAASGALERDAAGAPARLVGGCTDITDRKQVEERLFEAMKLESIGRLAGGIAHDFNNMLTVILSHIDLALADLPPHGSAARDLQQAHAAASRSGRLTSQLLAFARRQVVQPRTLDLNRLLETVGALLRRVLREDIELVIEPAATRPVRIDPHHFEQVLVNLATNARDAMETGGRLLLATNDRTLEAPPSWAPEAPPGTYVELEVRDTGSGIPADVLPRVFEPFFTTKAPGKGTGLGLASVYGTIHQGGGFIGVESAPGQGSVFRILLPTAAAEPEARPEAADPTPLAGGAETLLVVEDEEMVRRTTVRLLEQQGYRVLEACDGYEALELAARHDGQIDLVVSDVVMPRLGGPALAQTLRERRPGLPVLFVSGHVQEHEAAEALEGTALLSKPFAAPELARLVRRLLDARRR